MKNIYSYNHLQTFFNSKLEDSQKILNGLLLHSFEIEDFYKQRIEFFKNDYIYELDILQNRSTDCLSHYGIAKEISSIFNIKLKKTYFNKPLDIKEKRSIIKTDKCPKYIVLEFDNVSVSNKTSDKVKNLLKSISQKSIGRVVDLSNYILNEFGQPIHIFDREKLKGDLCVRDAKTGEKLELIGGRVIDLEDGDVVIVDSGSDKAIALAGIKGGSSTAVSEKTKNISIEIATFSSEQIRKTSRRLGIITDASKRFSQNYPSEILNYTAMEIKNIFDKEGDFVGAYTDTSINKNNEKTKIKIEIPKINNVLGTKFSKTEVYKLLDLLNFSYKKENEKTLEVEIPIERTDIKIAVDLIEELARIFGYQNIKPVAPTSITKNEAEIKTNETQAKYFYLVEKLNKLGFSEIMTTSFSSVGSVSVLKPVAKDKGKLRDTLKGNMKKALEENSYNGELLGGVSIKLFEIGSVFSKDKETIKICIGVKGIQGREKIKLGEIENELSKLFGIDVSFNELIFETDIENIKYPDVEIKKYTLPKLNKNIIFEEFSSYPFVLRDISVFVPNKNKNIEEETIEIIKNNSGSNLKQINFIDRWEDGEKLSLTFRLVFQSSKETLNDKLVGAYMVKLENKLKELKYTIR